MLLGSSLFFILLTLCSSLPFLSFFLFFFLFFFSASLFLDPIFLRRLFLLSTHYRCVPLSAAFPPPLGPLSTLAIPLFYPPDGLGGSRGGFVLRSKGKFIIRCLFGPSDFFAFSLSICLGAAFLAIDASRAPYRFPFQLFPIFSPTSRSCLALHASLSLSLSFFCP